MQDGDAVLVAGKSYLSCFPTSPRAT
ncbi:hypothetical protein SBA4_5580004 [Candidatus Sulfopaludibacter sp. SbA4]|nr:hypothetical protein SBA4_5580004 [Candidatus Sulfopaludibacter sp. SbA4]